MPSDLVRAIQQQDVSAFRTGLALLSEFTPDPDITSIHILQALYQIHRGKYDTAYHRDLNWVIQCVPYSVMVRLQTMNGQ